MNILQTEPEPLESRSTYLVVRTRTEDPQVYLVQNALLSELKSKCDADSRNSFLEFIHSLKPANAQSALSMSNNCFGGILLKREWKFDPHSRAQLHLEGLKQSAWQNGREGAIKTLAEARRQIDEELQLLLRPKKVL